MRSCPKRLLRVLQRVFTKQTQLQRALAAEGVAKFRAYLLESEELHEEVGIFVISDFPMEVEEALLAIERRKLEICGNLDNVEEIRKKLKILNQPNHARKITDELAFTTVTPERHGTLVKKVWKFLGDGSDSPDWTKLGFQNGKFPYTDFRGEGVLGLFCLVFLGFSNADRAREWKSRTSDLPFAILSINVTRWTRQLVHDKLSTPVDHFFYDCDDSRMSLLARFASLHWKIFEIFVDFWETAGESNSLMFPMRSEEFRLKLLPVLRQVQLGIPAADFPEYLSV